MPMQKPQGETRCDASGRLTLWHGQPVTYVTPPIKPDDPKFVPVSYPCYKRPDGSLEKIHFPDGRKLPATGDNTGVQGRDEEYTEEVREAYENMNMEGKFRDGIMPEVPPKKEWVNWDF